MGCCISKRLQEEEDKEKKKKGEKGSFEPPQLNAERPSSLISPPPAQAFSAEPVPPSLPAKNTPASPFLSLKALERNFHEEEEAQLRKKKTQKKQQQRSPTAPPSRQEGRSRPLSPMQKNPLSVKSSAEEEAAAASGTPRLKRSSSGKSTTTAFCEVKTTPPRKRKDMSPKQPQAPTPNPTSHHHGRSRSGDSASVACPKPTPLQRTLSAEASFDKASLPNSTKTSSSRKATKSLASPRRNSVDQESSSNSSNKALPSRRQERSPTLRRPTVASLNHRRAADDHCQNDECKNNGACLHPPEHMFHISPRGTPSIKLPEAMQEKKKQQSRIALKDLHVNCISTRDNPCSGKSNPVKMKTEDDEEETSCDKVDLRRFKTTEGMPIEKDKLSRNKEESKQASELITSRDDNLVETKKPNKPSTELPRSRSTRRSRERFLFPDVQTLLMSDTSGMSFEGLEGKLTMPASISKACSILEAVANLHMTSSICSETEEMEDDSEKHPSLSRFHFRGRLSSSSSKNAELNLNLRDLPLKGVAANEVLSTVSSSSDLRR